MSTHRVTENKAYVPNVFDDFESPPRYESTRDVRANPQQDYTALAHESHRRGVSMPFCIVASLLSLIIGAAVAGGIAWHFGSGMFTYSLIMNCI